MANAGNGGHGTDGSQQSIGSDTDQPIDGIEGSNPGTQQAAGQHVNAGGVGNGPGQRHEENRQQATPAPKQTGLTREGKTSSAGVSIGVAQPGSNTGAQQPMTEQDAGKGKLSHDRD
jgi:hypothetical protein